MYTQFESDRSIFHRLDTFSVENRVPKKRRAIRAKWSFFGRKSANFQNFSKSFQNLIKPIEIHIWSKKSAHLKHFWPFYGRLKAHFGPIFLIYKVQENRPFLPYLYSRLLKLLENGRFQHIAHYISKRRGGTPLRNGIKI